LAFLLFTADTEPLTVAITVVPSLCLSTVNFFILGAEYSYTSNALDVTVAVLPLVSVTVTITFLLPSLNAEDVNLLPVYVFPSTVED
jgi:hypothetical protein